MDPYKDKAVIAVLDRLNINPKGASVRTYQEYLIEVVGRFNDLMDHEQKGDATFKAEKFDEALEHYEAALYLSGMIFRFTANRGLSLILKRARTFLAQNNYSQAFYDAKMCLAIDRSTEAYSIVIEVLMGLKSYKDALQYATRVVDLYPGHKGLKALHERVLIEVQKMDGGSAPVKLHYNKELLLKKFASVRPHLRHRSEQVERFKEKATKLVSIGFVPALKKQRGLFANKDFPPNAILFKEHKPVVFATLAVDDSCQWCLRLLGSGQVACPQCHEEKYCCDQCRTSAWNDYHEGMCGVSIRQLATYFKTHHDNASPENLHTLMALKLIGKELTYNARNQTDLCAWELPSLDLYFSVLPVQTTDKRFGDIVKNYKFVVKALRTAKTAIDVNHFSLEWYLRVLGLIQQYNVVYRSFKYKATGGDTCGIYPLSSFINHSCVPNAQIGFVNNTIVITALQEIREGEQLFIDYFSTYPEAMPRNPSLEAIYGFKCSCRKCLRKSVWKI